MDTSDAFITFDERGFCNHCRTFERKLAEELPPLDRAGDLLARLVVQIKAEGRGRPYDCVIGLSGGVDSSYVALQVVRLGLRPLAIHLDNGWNSELAVKNIESIVRTLDIDLITHVLDWDEFADLQRSFFYASVSNCEMPTDHAINATLFHHAAKHRIRHIISGSNLMTEGMHLPPAWGHDNKDWANILDIHRKHGRVPLKTFPRMTFFNFLWYVFVRRIRFVPLLNLVPYRKDEVTHVIEKELGWRNYGRKHGESSFTRFYQEHYLPVKFGFDKRRLHLSTLIMSGQISREEALRQLVAPLFVPQELRDYEELFLKKLRFTREEWAKILATAPRAHTEYRHNTLLSARHTPLYRFGRKVATGRQSVHAS